MATASDDFNRADGDIGANWTDYQNAAEINSNTVRPEPGDANNLAAYNATSFTGNHRSQVVMATQGYLGPATRLQAGPDGYVWVGNSLGDNKLYRIDDGSYVALATGLANPSGAGATIRLNSSGSSHELFYDDVSQGSWNDSTYSGGQPGMYIYSTAARLDNWAAEDLGGGGSAPRKSRMTTMGVS